MSDTTDTAGIFESSINVRRLRIVSLRTEAAAHRQRAADLDREADALEQPEADALERCADAEAPR